MCLSDCKMGVCEVLVAESVGVEPTDLLQSPVFKTGAFDHSANSLYQWCEWSESNRHSETGMGF